MQTIIRVEKLAKTFNQHQALHAVDLNIHHGEMVALLGPSGSGKSTLCRAINRLETIDSGEILIEGKPLPQEGRELAAMRAELGMVFQSFNLFPQYTALQNVMLAGQLLAKERPDYKQNRRQILADIETQAKALLAQMGLSDRKNHYPHQLSGGMCQRASLARALVGKPKVLLLDEPLGALDAFTRMNMQDEILRIWKETGMTAIMVTHDVDEAVYLSDKVVVMTPRPGRITGTLDIKLARPRARSSEDFLHYRAEILRQLHYGGTIKEPNYYI